MSVFVNPAMNALALSCLLLGAAYYYYARRDTAAKGAYAEPARLGPLRLAGRGRATWLAPALIIAALALGALASARPIGAPDKSESGTAAMDVIIALDVSDSMGAIDALPNRLSYAKTKVAELVAAAPGNRYGLVLFAGEATVSCPLTADHDAFLTFLDGAGFARTGLPGSAMGEAVLTAATRFKPGELPRAVLVVSDGENTYGADPADAASSAKARGLKVFAMGVGTAEGDRIPVGRDFFGDTIYKRDRLGSVVRSKLDRAALDKIAAAGDGVAVMAADAGSIDALAGKLKSDEQKKVRGVPANAKEYGPYLSLGAFALLAAALLL